MTKEKFIMRDRTGNYAKDIAMYVSDLYKAKIFEENPKDFEKYGKEIILLDSRKGLELIAKEMEVLSNTIPEAERRLNNMKEGYAKFYDSTPKIKGYISELNRRTHSLIGASVDLKEQIIGELCEK